MADDDQFRTGFGTGDDDQGNTPWDVQNPGPDGPNGPGQPGRPWFGPKRFGYGLQPRSWQGWLITAGIVAFAVIIATTTKGHHSSFSAWALIPIAAVLIVRVVFMMQRR